MNKDFILSEIRRLASEAGGIPPGQIRFHSETGLKQSDWRGRYWARWGDALVEAGFQANEINAAIPKDQLLAHLATLLKEYGRFPVTAEIQLKSRRDLGFPSFNAFRRGLGSKQGQIAKLRAYLLERGEQELADLCVLTENTPEKEDDLKASLRSEVELGFVYLMKSGRFYKIGRTNLVTRRQREIGIQLPDELKLIHSIKTDDPSGIEAYWHKRFEAQRKNGEWFDLTAKDVAAFRRRKSM